MGGAGVGCEISMSCASEGAHPGQFRAVGDPTEGTLVVAATVRAVEIHAETAYPRTDELPFDSDRKRMTTMHRVEDCDGLIGDCESSPPQSVRRLHQGCCR